MIKTEMVCLGLETGVAVWKAQMDPLSYGGTPKFLNCSIFPVKQMISFKIGSIGQRGGRLFFATL